MEISLGQISSFKSSIIRCYDVYTLVEAKLEVSMHSTAIFRVLHGKSLIEGKNCKIKEFLQCGLTKRKFFYK